MGDWGARDPKEGGCRWRGERQEGPRWGEGGYDEGESFEGAGESFEGAGESFEGAVVMEGEAEKL